MPDFLHNDSEFKDLLAIVASKLGIDTALVEKDYWIMHALYGLQQQGIEFELKGGTSLSKGFGLIQRFQRILTFIPKRISASKQKEKKINRL